MKKLLYTVMCCCALASCTNLDSERYDAINPDFFPTNEKDAEALVVVSMPLSVVRSIAVYSVRLTVSRLLEICQPILLFAAG